MVVTMGLARPIAAVAHHGPNPCGGRDLVVGDVHGEFETLEEALRVLEFGERDRLFTVGDLIDRGPRSADALAWLESGRFTGGVRGNHEQMMVDALAAGESLYMRLSGPGREWIENGGDWWYDSSQVVDARRNEIDGRCWPHAERWLAALSKLPYLLTIEYARRCIGVVHAPGALNLGTDWLELVESVVDAGARLDPYGWEAQHLTYSLLWPDASSASETPGDTALDPAVSGVDLVLTGHSPGLLPRWTRDNVLCIDTGVHYRVWGHLTVAEVQDGLELHRFERVGR